VRADLTPASKTGASDDNSADGDHKAGGQR
jgi:hypothetical protein